MPDVAAASPPARPHAFVIDDVEGNRILATAYLERLGWVVHTFADAQAALDALESRLPQAMLVDIRMPGMTGDELARKVRAEPRTCAIRLVGYTAHALADEIAKVRSAGFDEVLIKPVLMADMRRVFAQGS